MLRIDVSEAGQGSLPAVDVDDAVVVIGSAPSARVRLPASIALAEHVRIEAGRWRALGDVKIGGVGHDAGDIGDGVTLEIGVYRVRIAPAPTGSIASPIQRTESLARELMRNLLGTSGAPTLEVERGPVAGAKRGLAPPESTLVIGRGDEAHWVIADKDLSREHAEVRRGWDGARIVDLGSKNGTKVDGDVVGKDGMALRDGCVIELGPIVMRFRDPAEKHLQGDAPAFRALAPQSSSRTPSASSPRSSSASFAVRESPRGNSPLFYAAVAIMLAALAGLVWIISS